MDQPVQSIYFALLDDPVPPGVHNLQRMIQDAWEDGNLVSLFALRVFLFLIWHQAMMLTARKSSRGSLWAPKNGSALQVRWNSSDEHKDLPTVFCIRALRSLDLSRNTVRLTSAPHPQIDLQTLVMSQRDAIRFQPES